LLLGSPLSEKKSINVSLKTLYAVLVIVNLVNFAFFNGNERISHVPTDGLVISKLHPSGFEITIAQRTKLGSIHFLTESNTLLYCSSPFGLNNKVIVGSSRTALGGCTGSCHTERKLQFVQ
jgi:hypothetical protein